MYNVKAIHYPNGETQLRRYSQPLNLRESNPYEVEQTEREFINFEYNPFDNKLTRKVYNFEDVEKLEKENAERSFKRTVQQIHTLSRCSLWEYFVTFTFNSQQVDRYNFDETSRLVRQYLRNQRRNAPALRYLVVPEQHKDGAFHFHALISNTGNIEFADSGKKTRDKKIIYNLAKWKYGFTTAIEVYNTHGASKYLAKYISKELCDLTKGKHRYFVSNNLDKPIADLFLMPDQEFELFLEPYANSLGKEIKHVSKPRNNCGFVDVDYYELQERKTLDDSKTSI